MAIAAQTVICNLLLGHLGLLLLEEFDLISQLIVLRFQFIVLIKNHFDVVQLLFLFLQLELLILDFCNQALLAIVSDFVGPCFFQVADSAKLHDGGTLLDQVIAHCNMAHDFIWPAATKHTIHIELQM